VSSSKILFFFALLHFGTFLQAQKKEEKESLGKILTHLESHYHCKFNFVLETTEHISIAVPPKQWSLKKAIDYLENETKLKFTILSNNFISIEPRGSFLFCGYLKDRDTKEPIIAATIQASSNSVISSETGYFELKVSNNKEMISIRHLGYKLKAIPMALTQQNTCADIFLIQQEEQLSEVVLTDFLTKGIDKLNDGSYLMNFSNSGILPGLIESDVLQTIQALPGVQSIDETVSDINIRGGTNDQNLFMWDGIKMYQSGHFFGLISIYNPMVAQHAKLTKNGSRVDLTDGVSGTIEMGTDNIINDEFKGSIGFNFINANAFVDAPLGKKSSFQIATRKALSNYLETPTYGSYKERILQGTEVSSIINNNSDIEFDFHDVNVRWLWQINAKNRIRLNLLNVLNEFDLYDKKIKDPTEESRSSNLFQNSWAVGIYYERTWNEKFKSQLQIYESDYNLKAINSTLLNGQRLEQKNRVSETGIKLNNFHTINDRWKLLHGYQLTETQILNSDVVDDPFYRLKISEVLRTHAVYAQIDFNSQNHQSRFKSGIRLNYLSKFNKYLIEPRISFNQNFLNHFTFQILGEFKHQTTSQIINFRNDFLGIEKRHWQLANDNDVPIIKGRQFSLGLHYSRNGWLISGEAYYKYVTGITAQGQGFQNQYEFTRAKGGYEAYGFDYLVRKKWKNIGTWLSYSNMENHYSFKSFSDSWFPNNLEIYNSITFGSSVDLNNLKIALGCNWHTGRPTTRPIIGNQIIDQRINYEPANSSRLDDYLRIDFSSTFKFNFSDKVHAEVGISIWNLLNRQNIISNYYRLNNTDVPLEETKTALRFTPNASFRVSF
jgi:hypothetical protein